MAWFKGFIETLLSLSGLGFKLVLQGLGFRLVKV
jgi:hypothetical protein